MSVALIGSRNLPKTDGDAVIQYFDGDRYVGSRRVYLCGYGEGGISYSAYWPHTAYFCPVCGNLWGREIVQPEFAYSPKVPDAWTIERRRCVEHGDGQFLCGKDLDYADKDLLTRELLALIEGAERYEHNRNFSPRD